MAQYQVTIRRRGNQGTLAFQSYGTAVNTQCWWSPAHVIVAGTYPSWRTRMFSKTDSVT